MKITCKYCGIVNKPHICPKVKRKYDYKREDKQVYASSKYRKVRNQAIKEYKNTCLLTLLIDKKIKPAEETHHIVEINDDISLAYDFDNLITLSSYRHEWIHSLYKSEDKEEIQEILRELCRIYRENGIKRVLDTPPPKIFKK